MQRILGIDPGLKTTGWGLIESDGQRSKFIASGSLHSDTKQSMPTRLWDLHTKLSKVLESYTIDVAAMEETFVNKNALSSLKLGHARGALMMAIKSVNLDLYEYSATKVKKTIVGVGRADKHQISTMVKFLLPTATFDTEDAADALAVAICHAHNNIVIYS